MPRMKSKRPPRRAIDADTATPCTIERRPTFRKTVVAKKGAIIPKEYEKSKAIFAIALPEAGPIDRIVPRVGPTQGIQLTAKIDPRR